MTKPTSRRPPRTDRQSAKPTARAARRKQSPPVQTNELEIYYKKQMAAKTAVVVVLQDGEELEGAIEWYDKNAIKLTRSDQPNLMIPRHYIRYIFEEKERRRQQRREAKNGRDAEARQAGPSNGPESGAENG